MPWHNFRENFLCPVSRTKILSTPKQYLKDKLFFLGGGNIIQTTYLVNSLLKITLLKSLGSLDLPMKSRKFSLKGRNIHIAYNTILTILGILLLIFKLIYTYPVPEPPTIAIFFPAGIEQDNPSKTGFPSVYLKHTSSNSIVALSAVK